MDFFIASALSMDRESFRYQQNIFIPNTGLPSLGLWCTSAVPSRGRCLIFVQKQVLLAKAVRSLAITEGKKALYSALLGLCFQSKHKNSEYRMQFQGTGLYSNNFF